MKWLIILGLLLAIAGCAPGGVSELKQACEGISNGG
jgi:hypothetical protein